MQPTLTLAAVALAPANRRCDPKVAAAAAGVADLAERRIEVVKRFILRNEFFIPANELD